MAAPTYGANSFYSPVIPKSNVPKVKLPAGMTINQGQSDADFESFLTGGGAWGQYSNPVPASQTNQWSNSQTQQDSTPAVAGHWNVPDYDALLAADWEPGAAAVTGQKMRDESQAGFQAALRRAFIDFGGDPTSLDDRWRKYLDEPTIEAAKNNKFSKMAMNLKAMTKNLRQQRAEMDARGRTFSGRQTGIAREALEGKQLADVTAGRAFTDVGEEGLRGLGTVEGQIAQLILDAQSRARARIGQENPHTWDPGTPAGGSETTTSSSGSTSTTGGTSVPGTVFWGGTNMNASQLAAELSRTGVNRATWIMNHPAAAKAIGWA